MKVNGSRQDVLYVERRKLPPVGLFNANANFLAEFRLAQSLHVRGFTQPAVPLPTLLGGKLLGG